MPPPAQRIMRITERIVILLANNWNFLSNITTYLDVWNLDAGTGTFARFAVDPHPVIRPVEHFHSLIHVTHSDALLEKRRQPDLGDPDAVVFYHQVESAIGQVAAHADHSAIHFSGQPMPDAVLDQRLQKHTGHQAVESFGIDFMMLEIECRMTNVE